MTSRFSLLPLALASCLAAAAPVFCWSQEGPAKLVQVFSGIETPRPITLAVPPDGTKRLFLIQQRGQVRILPKDEKGTEAVTFLDLADHKMEASEQSKFEEGLNGFAFHPKFAENKKFYLYYTMQEPKRAVLSEMRVSASDPNKADPSTERVLLEIPLPFWNHHSGNLAFGKDGLLYFTTGDGGGKGGDPLRWAQNTMIFNGKVLRIDVDGKTGARPYGIPADNPWVGNEGAREEIYANGLRNPWGLSFDAEGTLWCADVGQDLFEEINHIEKGGNYGWSIMDGKQRFVVRKDEPLPDGVKFVEPAFIYDHTQGLSITGGYVYQGAKLPKLRGSYLYGDWVMGKIWALNYDKAGKKAVSNDLLYKSELNPKGKATFQPTAFCPDADGEPLALDWSGKIYRIVMP